MKKYIFLLSVGIFLGVINMSFPQNSFAQVQSEISVEVLNVSTVEVFCTQYDAPDSSTCIAGFPFSAYTVLLDKKTGNIILQTVEAVLETYQAPIGDTFFTVTRRRATGKIKTCLVGKLGAEITVNTFQFNQAGTMVCP